MRNQSERAPVRPEIGMARPAIREILHGLSEGALFRVWYHSLEQFIGAPGCYALGDFHLDDYEEGAARAGRPLDFTVRAVSETDIDPVGMDFLFDKDKVDGIYAIELSDSATPVVIDLSCDSPGATASLHPDHNGIAIGGMSLTLEATRELHAAMGHWLKGKPV